jgi:DNA polymerase-3 subunit delta
VAARGGRGGARAGASGAATLEGCLAEIRAGTPAPVYLLDGDPFLSLRGARQLVEALVPEAARSLNLVELDPAASPGEVAAEVATGGLFGGGKVVLVQEPAFLTAREDLEEALARAREQWGEGRQREAARRLLAVVGKGGLQAADLVPPEGEDEGAFAAGLGATLRKALGFRPDEAELAFAVAAGRFALEREMKTARDDTARLDEALERGFPPGHVLVLAAGKVDGRLPLAKRLAAAGRRVQLAVGTVGDRWDAPPDLAPLVTDLLAGTGKRADPRAVARLAELVGPDARVLAGEVGKLVSFVGDRTAIGPEDVDEVVVRTAADPFFALGNAVEARDLPLALEALGRALEDGASPHMLLGSLAATVRRLVLEKERARAVAGARRLASAREWEATVFPTIPPREVGQKKPYGFWMKYQASTRFGLEELLDGVVALHQADVAMKSGQDGRLRLERVLLGLLGTAAAERSGT